MSSERFHSSWTVNLLQEKRLSFAKRKISIKIVFYVCCMQHIQHIFNKQLYTIERKLAKVMLNSEQKVIIIKDFNAHHSWWNAKISNFIRTKVLIKWVNLHKCNLINTSDINTYHSYSNQLNSILDLAFTSKNMHNHIKN